ncbi:hypothetical protein [Microcoleus sp. D3_18a_C4]|uniref:hypothetical protein n=1 Tax=unclassified Microcoleus TaxID=2642155 RepID=UPI002FCF437D
MPSYSKNDNVEEELTLKVRSRPTTTVSIEIPTDTLESLNQVALHRDMPLSALLKFYIGQGLRQDLTKLFSDRLLEATAQVLARHLHSEEEVSTILREIQSETAR